jgi:hypothetical protein
MTRENTRSSSEVEGQEMELFSQRQRRLRGETHDVYTYDELPEGVRVQVIHIWDDVLGNSTQYHSYSGDGRIAERYEVIVNYLCREYGVFKLPGTSRRSTPPDFRAELQNFLLTESDVERCLDAIEVSFQIIDKRSRQDSYNFGRNAASKVDSALEELNRRLRDGGVGYQFIDREIIRVDSQLLHAELVLPALKLLRQIEYAGAQEEYLSAHEHFRHGRSKEALTECLKAFESMLKAICVKRAWEYNPNATAKGLIQTCLDHELIPKFWQEFYTSLRCLLESGVPTGRNKLSGHGQGPLPVTVPEHITAYMLHMTAASLVFLAEAERKIEVVLT